MNARNSDPTLPETCTDAVTSTTGVILSVRAIDGHLDKALVEIATERQVRFAVAAMNSTLREVARTPLLSRNLMLVKLDSSNVATYLLGVQSYWIGPGLRHIPESVCPVDGVVGGITALVDSIAAIPLRNFVESVLARRDVHRVFWTMAAAARHHHSAAGGLAAHSLEVATDLDAQHNLSGLEHDLGIAGALLHDIGKVWSYTSDMFLNEEAKALGHEQLGLKYLQAELCELETAWPDGGLAMRSLLGGQSNRRENGTMPMALLARIKAADQRSCERDRSTSIFAKTRNTTWTPKGWHAPDPADETLPF